MDVAKLLDFVDAFLTRSGAHLTDAERVELLHVAQGDTMETSANKGSFSIETIRARRKAILKKLKCRNVHELVAVMLDASMAMAREAARR